jgi:hypothetical protein
MLPKVYQLHEPSTPCLVYAILRKENSLYLEWNFSSVYGYHKYVYNFEVENNVVI